MSRDGLLVTAARRILERPAPRSHISVFHRGCRAEFRAARRNRARRRTGRPLRRGIAVRQRKIRISCRRMPRKWIPSVAGVLALPPLRTPSSNPWCSPSNPIPRPPKSCAAFFRKDGYTVIIVPTAQQALDILRTTVPAVFLAEVEGTDMSGHDLCLIIKRNDRLQRVPVILLTQIRPARRLLRQPPARRGGLHGQAIQARAPAARGAPGSSAAEPRKAPTAASRYSNSNYRTLRI